jgi:hypothetical protein
VTVIVRADGSVAQSSIKSTVAVDDPDFTNQLFVSMVVNQSRVNDGMRIEHPSEVHDQSLLEIMSEQFDTSYSGYSGEDEFIMRVDDVSLGDGTVIVFGNILKGDVSVGTEVELVSADGDYQHARVVEMIAFNRELTSAGEGEDVGLVFELPFREVEALVAVGSPMAFWESSYLDATLIADSAVAAERLESGGTLLLYTPLTSQEPIPVTVERNLGDGSYSIDAGTTLFLQYDGMDVAVCDGDCLDGNGLLVAQGFLRESWVR